MFPVGKQATDNMISILFRLRGETVPRLYN